MTYFNCLTEPWPQLTAAMLLIVVFVAGTAVLNPKVQDTVLERIALVLICFSGLSLALTLYQRITVSVSAVVFTASLAAYALLRLMALYKRKCARRKTHD